MKWQNLRSLLSATRKWYNKHPIKTWQDNPFKCNNKWYTSNKEWCNHLVEFTSYLARLDVYYKPWKVVTISLAGNHIRFHTIVTRSVKTRHNCASVNFQYKILNVMGKILAYLKYCGIFLNAWFIGKQTSNNTNLDIIYLPTQEEFKNFCFVAVDLRTRQSWVFVYGTSEWSYEIDFSSLISPLFTVKKGDTWKHLPSIWFPYSWQTQWCKL